MKAVLFFFISRKYLWRLKLSDILVNRWHINVVPGHVNGGLQDMSWIIEVKGCDKESFSFHENYGEIRREKIWW